MEQLDPRYVRASTGTKVRHTVVTKSNIIIQVLHVLVQISRKQWSQGQWMASCPGGLTNKVQWCTV